MRLARSRLDQSEVNAVKTARKHGKPWTAIATTMGVSKEAALERCGEFDESA